MKNFYFIIGFLLITNVFTQAQSVFPDYEDKPSWRVSESGWHGVGGLTYTLWMEKDTNLCGKTYNSIIAIDYPKLADTTIVGYYRQENKRVFFRLYNESCEIGKEYIIYDFSLKVNDSLYIGNGLIAVIGDERYETYEGVGRRTLGISYTNGYRYYGFGTWIEGVGELHNPFTTPFCIGVGCYDGSIINCMKTKEGIQFSFSEEGCQYGNLPTNIKRFNLINGKIELHSNPIKTGTFIQLNYQVVSALNGNLYISNAFGQLLFSSKIDVTASEGNLDLPWSPSVPGIYWLVIESDKGERQTLQLVAQ